MTSATLTVRRVLKEERARIDRALGGLRHELLQGLGDRDRAPLEYALSTDGKRIRPLLCVLAYRAVQPERDRLPEALYRLSCALELVHVYSLVHDDLPCMDDDDLRRGRPTVHRVFGVGTAIRSGAALLPMAVSVLARQGRALGLDAGEVARLVRELSRAAGAEGMVAGQLMDLEAEGRSVTADELERIHRAKTGALLTGALRIGAIAAGASEADPRLQHLTRFGEALGLAFQIADDLLDVTGSDHMLGKAAGRDAALEKASYPAVHGVERAREMARERVAEAKAAVSGLGVPGLGAIADFVIERES